MRDVSPRASGAAGPTLDGTEARAGDGAGTGAGWTRTSTEPMWIPVNLRAGAGADRTRASAAWARGAAAEGATGGGVRWAVSRSAAGAVGPDEGRSARVSGWAVSAARRPGRLGVVAIGSDGSLDEVHRIAVASAIASGSGGGGAVRPGVIGRRDPVGAVAGSPMGAAATATGSVHGRSTTSGTLSSSAFCVRTWPWPPAFAGATISGGSAGCGGISSRARLAGGGGASDAAASGSSEAATANGVDAMAAVFRETAEGSAGAAGGAYISRRGRNVSGPSPAARRAILCR